MKRYSLLGIIAAMTLLVLIQIPSAGLGQQDVTAKSHTSQPTVAHLGSIRPVFNENLGQWDERIRFRANTGAVRMWFTTDGVYYQFTRRACRAPLLVTVR
jgi:hypothetical protein